MKIQEFKQMVSSVIYKRGEDYFLNGHVHELKQELHNQWNAIVVGTDDYKVSVQLNNAHFIISSFCDCPFDYEKVCKHQVAVFLSILEAMKQPNQQTFDLHKMLKSMKKTDIIDLVTSVTSDQPSVKELFVDQFIKKDLTMNEATALRTIRQSLSRATRKGFIEWNKTHQALEGTETVLQYVKSLFKDGKNDDHIVRLCIQVLHECAKMSHYADDSYGAIGDRMNICTEFIDRAVDNSFKKWDDQTTESMFNLIIKEMSHQESEVMNDTNMNLFKTCVKFTTSTLYRKKLESILESMIIKEENSSKTYDYIQENLRFLQLKIIIKNDGDKEIESFLTKHVHYSTIREEAIKRAFIQNNPQKVLELCLDGEKSDASFSGLVHRWTIFRYQAYKNMKRTEEMKKLALDLLLDGEYTYFGELKTIIPDDEWPKFVQHILSEFEQKKHQPNIYLEILISEKETQRLLKYCQKNNSAILTCYPHLIKECYNEVVEIFSSYIHSKTEASSNRKQYKKVCKDIKLYKKALGVQSTHELIDELTFLYQKRSALIDELSKVIK